MIEFLQNKFFRNLEFSIIRIYLNFKIFHAFSIDRKRGSVIKIDAIIVHEAYDPGMGSTKTRYRQSR